MRKLVLLVSMVAVLVAGAPAPAVQGGVVVTAGFTYIPGDAKAPTGTLTILHGTELLYLNAEPLLAPHSVTSRDRQPGTNRRLFDSGLLQPGQTALVRGVENLRVGTYPLICTVHPDMSGNLVVI